MLDQNDTRLSQDQKLLVQAFNTVAAYFKDRILGKDLQMQEIGEDIEALVRDDKGEQANSYLSSQAVFMLIEAIGDDGISYGDAIKNGGTVQSNRYFVEETLITSNSEESELIAEKCRLKILEQLLFTASRLNTLPQEYIRNESQRLGFITKP